MFLFNIAIPVITFEVLFELFLKLALASSIVFGFSTILSFISTIVSRDIIIYVL